MHVIDTALEPDSTLEPEALAAALSKVAQNVHKDIASMDSKVSVSALENNRSAPGIKSNRQIGPITPASHTNITLQEMEASSFQDSSLGFCWILLMCSCSHRD